VISVAQQISGRLGWRPARAPAAAEVAALSA
jgi:hypothetical protein